MAHVKANIFNKELTKSLSLAVGALDVFKAPSKNKNSNEDDVKMLALRKKLHISRAPALAILNLILSDKQSATIIEDYAGIWMSSLNVVIAPKPSLTSLALKKIQNYSDDNDINDDEESNNSITASSNDNDSIIAELTSPHDKKERNSSTNESRRNSVAAQLSTGYEGKGSASNGNYYDQTRNIQNNEREKLLKYLITSLEEKNNKDKKLKYLDTLKGFCEDPLDGKRLLLKYAIEKYKLHKNYKKKLIDKSIYMKNISILQLDYKKNAFNKLKEFKLNRTKSIITQEVLLKKTRDYCIDVFDNKASGDRSESLQKSLGSADNDGTNNSYCLKNSFKKRSYIIDNIDEIEENEIKKLNLLEEKLKNERIELRKKYIEKYETRNTEDAKDDENEYAFFNHVDGGETAMLSKLSDEMTEKNDQFLKKFMSHMTNSAQIALEALDKRFVEGDFITGDDRDEAMDELLWNMSERKWQTDTAESNRISFCQDLIQDLDEKLKDTNKKIYQYELERIEEINEWNKAGQR